MAQTILKELTYDGSKVIVEVAKRDAKGNTIDSTYLTQTDWSTANAKKLDVTTFNTYINTTAPATYVKIDGFKANYLDANSVAYKSDVTDAVGALDFSQLTLGAAETIKAISQTDGKLTATKQTITITSSNISDTLPDSKIASAATWNAKQNKLTFDAAPTANSSNPVTSNGIKTYVDSAIEGVSQFKYEVISSLPTASADTMGKIYLIKDAHATNDNYDEYITVTTDNKVYSWEIIGNTDIDITGYVKKTTTVNGHALSSNVTVTKSDVGLGSVANAPMDTEVTEGSTNYISSGAVYDRLSDQKIIFEGGEQDPVQLYWGGSYRLAYQGRGTPSEPGDSYQELWVDFPANPNRFRILTDGKGNILSTSQNETMAIMTGDGINMTYKSGDISPGWIKFSSVITATDVTIDLQ